MWFSCSNSALWKSLGSLGRLKVFLILLFIQILGPHAGYRYCGACAAHAYSQIDPTNVKRVFILGPSHHYRLNGCAVSDCTKYATPLYDLTVSFFIVNFLTFPVGF